MRTIGLRATPNSVVFAIFDTDANEVLNIEEIKLPLALSRPDALKFARNNLLDVLREYDVQLAGIRITESMAQKLSIDRIQIEGVIQEAFASSNLANYYTGQISSIASRLNIPRADLKKYIDGDLDWDVENWLGLNKVKREALLCAIGAISA